MKGSKEKVKHTHDYSTYNDGWLNSKGKCMDLEKSVFSDGLDEDEKSRHTEKDNLSCFIQAAFKMEEIMHDIEIKKIARMAIDVRDRAYAPYSKYHVGACVLGDSGAYYSGCNIENASFGLSICAERTAVFKGVSECEKAFHAIAIAGQDNNGFPMPCGACRQVLAEFCSSDMPVIVVNAKGDYRVYTLGQLLPESFGKSQLNT